MLDQVKVKVDGMWLRILFVRDAMCLYKYIPLGGKYNGAEGIIGTLFFSIHIRVCGFYDRRNLLVYIKMYQIKKTR